MKKYLLLLFLCTVTMAPFFGESNLALNKLFDFKNEQTGNEAVNAVDGSTDTRWAANYFPQWIEVDLQQIYAVNKTEILPYMNRAYQYKIEGSTDNIDFTTLVDNTDNTTGGSILTDNFTDSNVRYVRLTVTGCGNIPTATWTSLYEFRVYGDESGREVIYSTGFENTSYPDENLTKNGCVLTNSYPYNGNYSMEIGMNDTLIIEQNTVGYNDITVEFMLQTRDCNTGNFFICDYYNGSSWSTLFTQLGNTSWTLHSFTIPDSAFTNSGFAIKFYTNSYNSVSTAYIDDFKIKGRKTNIAPDYEFEAENGNMELSNALIFDDIRYSNQKYVSQLGTGKFNEIIKKGTVSFEVNVPATGDYILTTYYSTNNLLDFDIAITNGSKYKMLYEVHNCLSASWDEIMSKALLVRLKAGCNTIKYYNDFELCPKLDEITIQPVTYPANSFAPVYAPYTVSLEAENAVLDGGNLSSGGRVRCSNEGMVNAFSGSGKAIYFFAPVKQAGEYMLSLYYVCHDYRSISLQVNDSTPSLLSGLSSGGKDTVEKRDIKVTLNSGNNVIKLFYADDNPSALTPEIDRITISEILEAESGVLSGSASVFNSEIFLNGTGVGNLGNGSTLTLKTYAPVDGYYTLSVYYVSEGPRSFFIKANNEDPVELRYCNSRSWGYSGNKEIDVLLKQGENTLLFYNDSAYCPDFDMLTMRYTEEQDLKKYYGKHILLNLERWQCQGRDSGVELFLSRMDTVYEKYHELVGYVPFNGRIIEVKSKRITEGGAQAGNPIFWGQNKNENDNPIKFIVDKNDWSFGIMHEIGHTFDLGYTADNSCGWNFNGEFWANFKMYYVVEATNARTHHKDMNDQLVMLEGADLRRLYYDLINDSYQYTIFNSQRYHHDGLTYCYIRIRDKYGWQPFKSAFSFFTSYSVFPEGNLPKFDRFLDQVNRYLPEGESVESTFLPGEWEFVRSGVIALKNTAFNKKDTEVTPTDWVTSMDDAPGATVNFSADSATYTSNDYSAKITITGDPGSARYKQDCEVKPNTHYRLTVKVKTSNVSGSGLSVSLQMQDLTVLPTTPAYVTNAPDWQDYVIDFTTGNAIFGVLQLNLNGSGTVWFDDLKLEVIP